MVSIFRLWLIVYICCASKTMTTWKALDRCSNVKGPQWFSHRRDSGVLMLVDYRCLLLDNIDFACLCIIHVHPSTFPLISRVSNHPCFLVPLVLSRPSLSRVSTSTFRDCKSTLASFAVRCTHSRSGFSPTSNCRTPAHTPPKKATGSFTTLRKMGSSSKGPGRFGYASAAPTLLLRTRRILTSGLGLAEVRDSARAPRHVIFIFRMNLEMFRQKNRVNMCRGDHARNQGPECRVCR